MCIVIFFIRHGVDKNSGERCSGTRFITNDRGRVCCMCVFFFQERSRVTKFTSCLTYSRPFARIDPFAFNINYISDSNLSGLYKNKNKLYCIYPFVDYYFIFFYIFFFSYKKKVMVY